LQADYLQRASESSARTGLFGGDSATGVLQSTESSSADNTGNEANRSICGLTPALRPALTEQDAAQAGPDPFGQLARAEAKWRTSRTDAYEFRFHYACNDLVPQPRSRYPGLLFRVKHGESTLINSAGQPVRMAPDAQYATVERLFDFIRKESTGHPAKLDVQYDPA
jgi:hypothetical protein